MCLTSRILVAASLGCAVAMPAAGEIVAQYDDVYTSGTPISAGSSKAQAFEVTGSPTVTEIQLKLVRSVSDTATVYVTLYRDNNEKPGTGVISIGRAVAVLPTGQADWVSFKIGGGGVALSPGRYWITCKVSSFSSARLAWTATQCWEIANGNPYGATWDTKRSLDWGGTWPDVMIQDLHFRVFGSRTSKDTTTTVSVDPAKVADGGTCKVTVSVRDEDGNLINGPAKVTLTQGGGTLGASTLTLSGGQGTTSWTAPASAGSRTITASFPAYGYGGVDYGPSSGSDTTTVFVPNRGTTVYISANPSTVTTRESIPVSATVMDDLHQNVPGGDVTFKCTSGQFSCGQRECTVAVSGGTASTTWTAGNGVGTFSLEADYGGHQGTTVYYGANSDSQSVTVNYTQQATSTTVWVSPDYAWPETNAFVKVVVRETATDKPVIGGTVQLTADPDCGTFESTTLNLRGGWASTIWKTPATTGDVTIRADYQVYHAVGNEYLTSWGDHIETVSVDPDDPDDDRTWMSQWNSDYSWPNDPLPLGKDCSRNFTSKLIDWGWDGDEYFNNTACEEYMKKAGLTHGGKESDYMDTHDLTWYDGHGSSESITFITWCDNFWLTRDETYHVWGDKDADWAMLNACEVMCASSNWASAMDGLHMICGFKSISFSTAGFGKIFADMLVKDGDYDEPHTIRQAWFIAGDWDQCNKGETIVQRIIAETYAQADDYIWGQGYVSPDPTPVSTHVPYGNTVAHMGTGVTAEAGGDYDDVSSGVPFQLDGSASGDPTIGTYHFYVWDLDLSSNTDSHDWDDNGTDGADDDMDAWGPRPQVTFNEAGTHQIRLIVRDDQWDVAADYAWVRVDLPKGDGAGSQSGPRAEDKDDTLEIIDNFPGLPTDTMLPRYRMIGAGVGQSELAAIGSYFGMGGTARVDGLGNWNLVEDNRELIVNEHTGAVMYLDRDRAYRSTAPSGPLPTEEQAIQMADSFLATNGIAPGDIVLDSVTDMVIETVDDEARHPTTSVPLERRVNYRRMIDAWGPPSEPYPVVGPGGKITVMFDGSGDPILMTKIWRDLEWDEEVLLNPAGAAIADFHRLGPEALIGSSWLPPADRVIINDVSLGYYEAGFISLQPRVYPVYVLDLTCEDDRGVRRLEAYLPAVAPPIETSIDAPADPHSVDYGTIISFSGSATGGLPPYTYEWDSDKDGLLGTQPTIQAQLRVNHAEGLVVPHTIALRVTDSTGMFDEAHIDVTVWPWVGDLDADGDMDRDDHTVFYACLAGPDMTEPPDGCTEGKFELADLDDDGDVDLDDFGEAQYGFSGSGACGNGLIEGDEECDDNGESAQCDGDCTSVLCGDGTVNVSAGEQCDDGGASAVCDADCTNVFCPDGLVNFTAGEECDDGGESAFCDADCTLAVCGDGTVNATAGEACDDGGESAACDPDCTAVECGDGTLNLTAGEACDDGNTTSGDGCSGSCQIEVPQLLPDCVVSFDPIDGPCPNMAAVCGALFVGGVNCEPGGLCAVSEPYAYEVSDGAPLNIVLDGDLNRLSVAFSGAGGSVGNMMFFDLDHTPLDEVLTSSGDCLVDPPALQTISFSRPVREILLAASGGSVWIDAFHVNPPLEGACCDGAVCTEGPEAECSGQFLGFGTSCEPNNPCAGACCLTGGACQEVVGEDACPDGTFLGLETDCTPNPCTCDTIAEAKARPLGEEVAVCNVVVSSVTDLTAGPSGKSFHLQDDTGGLTVYGTNADINTLLDGISEGDEIDLRGTISEYNGLLELVGPFELVTNHGSAGIPLPTPTTTDDYQDGSPTAEGVESMLAQLDNVVFQESGSFAGQTDYTVSADGGATVATVRIATNELDLVGEPIPQGTVNLTGIFSQFDTTSPYDAGYELLPRSMEDIVELQGPVWIEPELPLAGESITVHYDSTGRPLEGFSPIYAHYGFNNWDPATIADAEMSLSGGGPDLEVTVSSPSFAWQLDVVFWDGTGTWDNNGGLDWQFAVTDGWILDGSLDPGAMPVSSNGPLELYAGVIGDELYVAIADAGEGSDHFVFVATPPGPMVNAPWAKAGLVAQANAILAEEDDNHWTGWIEAPGTPTASSASGGGPGWLEGTINLVELLGAMPANVHLAFGAYPTNDGEPLLFEYQVPPSLNLDGNLDVDEYVVVDPESIRVR